MVAMTRFRPCIDLHSGQVKQIVGGTLTTASADLKTNYVSKLPAGHFAKLYKDNDLTGAHVIMLGPGNEEAAKETLVEWRGGLQVGGGITDANAAQWIEWGAGKVCVYMVLIYTFSLLMYNSRLSLLPTSSHLGSSLKNDLMLCW
jgi:phosphoribosylformimino-5-aminoimidazole carboxamide ribotide isomerase